MRWVSDLILSWRLFSIEQEKEFCLFHLFLFLSFVFFSLIFFIHFFHLFSRLIYIAPFLISILFTAFILILNPSFCFFLYSSLNELGVVEYTQWVMLSNEFHRDTVNNLMKHTICLPREFFQAKF